MEPPRHAVRTRRMKTTMHPTYDAATVTCASCGTTFETRSTKRSLRVETCSNCHPHYTGTRQLIDAGGRIERFQRRLGRVTRS